MSNITCIAGLPGRGKTATAVYVAYTLYYRRGRKVISNTPLEFKYEHLPTPIIPANGGLPASWEHVLDDPENRERRAAVIIDEVHRWVDSRRSMTDVNVELTEFFTQMRKYGLDCYYTLQDWGMVDVRVRRVTTHFIQCERITPYGFMHGLLYQDPYHRPHQRPRPLRLYVKPVLSLFNTHHRIKTAPRGRAD